MEINFNSIRADIVRPFLLTAAGMNEGGIAEAAIKPAAGIKRRGGNIRQFTAIYLNMKDYIEQRVVECAEFISQSGATVRRCAKEFCVSKSTVHKDVAERLPQIDKELFEKVKRILGENLAQRHVRGGEATKMKYGKSPLRT